MEMQKRKLIITPSYSDYVNTCAKHGFNIRRRNKYIFINCAERLADLRMIKPEDIIRGDAYDRFTEERKTTIEQAITHKTDAYKLWQWVSL